MYPCNFSRNLHVDWNMVIIGVRGLRGAASLRSNGPKASRSPPAENSSFPFPIWYDNNLIIYNTGGIVDAFEQVVSEILWREGFWVRTSFKVELTPDHKKAISRPSSPRWEIDVVGYHPADNVLRIVECKSFLDSLGVGAKWLDPANELAGGRYKLFSDANLRKVVLNRLTAQFIEAGMCLSKPKIKLCLACGKI